MELYKTYRVIAQREDNGKIFSDTVCAARESEARSNFRQIYRHSTYSIIGVEVVKNVPLEQIISAYDGEIRFEVSEMPQSYVDELHRDMHEAGWNFSRSEAAYQSCLYHIFEKA